MKLAHVAFALLVALSASGFAQAQTTYYVDDDALPGGDGLSWGTAFNYLQDAVTTAISGDEIRVAEGTYRPDLGEGFVFGDNGASFIPNSDVTICGGYAGILHKQPDILDPAVYVTTLDGDLFGDDAHEFGSMIENTSAMITSIESSTGTLLLKHLRIINASDSALRWFHSDIVMNNVYMSGPEMIIGHLGGKSEIIDCFFTQPLLEDSGITGLTHCSGVEFASSDTVIKNSVFLNLTCFDSCFVRNADSIVIQGSTFSYNRDIALVIQGVASGSTLLIEQCEFIQNGYSEYSGGAIRIESASDVEITNTIFNGNKDSVLLMENNVLGLETMVSVTNSVLAGNTSSGPLIKSLVGSQDGYIDISLISCISEHNFPSLFQSVSPELSGRIVLSADYSAVPEPDDLGMNNISQNPLLVSPLGPDGMAGTDDEDFRLMPGSPCIDAGNSDAAYNYGVTCDFDGAPRFFDDPATPDTGVSTIGFPVTDMGAYEYRDQPPIACPTDINGDCLMDTADLGLLLGVFGTADPFADINGDGIVDTADLGLLLGAFGQVCP